MKYFNTLPNVLNVDSNNNIYSLKNLLVRAKLLPKLSKNVLIFYKYTIQDGDTPESIAYKYYGDQYRYWIVLYSNEILDPLWSWPLSSSVFSTYLENKYASKAQELDMTALQYTNSTIHHYEKVITTVDSESLTKTIKNVEIGLEEYNTLQENQTTRSFTNGASVNYSLTKKAVSIWDYENNLNEAKRDINLIKSNYVEDMERQFQKLMSV